MTRRLVVSYLTITAFVLLILEIPLAVTFARAERDRLTADLERDARVMATLSEDDLEGRSDIDLQGLVQGYHDRTGGRAVIVDKRGRSVADSETTRPLGRSFRDRPEFAAALGGRTASLIRDSTTLGGRYLWVAVPVASSGNVYGAVRVSYPTSTIDGRVRRSWLALAALAGVVLAAVAAVGTILARQVTRPLRTLAQTSERLARGDLSARAVVDRGPPEVDLLADRFNVMAAQIESLVGSQRAFVANASHELRTPLTALRLRLENLQYDAPPALGPQIDAAVEETGRLGRLVEGLLAIARAEGRTPELETIDLSAVAAERVETWSPLAAEQQVALVLHAPGPVAVRAVAGGVAQVLDNYLANALEVAPPGSTVTVGVRAAGGRGELHVCDQGPGLGDEERARAFDRFWRAPGAPAGGSGLGLAIVAQLVRAGGGTVALLPVVPHGIDAVAALPLAREDAAREPSRP